MQFIEISTLEDYYYYIFSSFEILYCRNHVQERHSIRGRRDAIRMRAIVHICVLRFISSFALIECHRMFSHWFGVSWIFFSSSSSSFDSTQQLSHQVEIYCRCVVIRIESNIILLITRLAQCDLNMRIWTIALKCKKSKNQLWKKKKNITIRAFGGLYRWLVWPIVLSAQKEDRFVLFALHSWRNTFVIRLCFLLIRQNSTMK